MPLFTLTNQKLHSIKETHFDLEKDLQSVIEANLLDLLGYVFVTTEFSIEELRFDTLAYDEEQNAFVIIEYKNSANYSVVDQGMAYLQVLLSRKADFVLEYNTRFPTKAKRKEDFDWSQTRVVFIAPYFTNYQIRAASFRDAPFDMYEIHKYENSMISLSQMKRVDTKESINTVLKGKDEAKVTNEIKTYSVDDYFKSGWEASREVYDRLHERIMAFDSTLNVVFTSQYIGYKNEQRKLLFHINMFKAGPCITFNRAIPTDFTDPNNRAKPVQNAMKYYNQNHVTFWLNGEASDDIEYALMLVKQQIKRLA